MSWIQYQITRKGGHFTHPHALFFLSAPSSPNSLPNNQIEYQKESSSGNKISPAILFIIVIVAVIFFISGILHLLVKFLLKQRSSVSESSTYPQDMSGSDAFERQLQHLFHLHDSGLDQAFIDALPVFMYKDIVGLKEPFDCAVCLCEFSEKDKLRLLPACSHAFHIDCIDTWLLSNSTCPLCRATLYTPGLPFENPIFDFDFGFESTTQDDEFTSNSGSGGLKPIDQSDQRINSRRVFSVRLGKFKNTSIERGEGETSSSNLDARRCFSMGSYQYIVADSDFKVPFCTTRGGNGSTNNSIKLVKGRNGQIGNLMSEGDVEGKKVNIRSKGESFSVSKIWQWSKKDKFQTSCETQLDSSSTGAVAVGLPWTLNDRTQHT